MKKYYLILLLMVLGVFLIYSFFHFLGGKKLTNINKNTRSISTSEKNIKEDISKNSDQAQSTSILFVGDLMFDRYIGQTARAKGNDFIFEKVKSLLSQSNLATANLEGPLTDNDSKSINTLPGEPHHLIFTFNKSLASTLHNDNIRVVNIGNNHVLNFGRDGLVQTEKSLEENKVEYFGDVNSENKTLVENINGIKIGFANYNQFSPGSEGRVLAEIPKLKKETDIVVVYTHWGQEYKLEAGNDIKQLAHRFIDAGADLIIGTHPHVIEPEETYNGKRIYYSLGNFVFDQYFSPQTQEGLAVKVTINADKTISFEETKLQLKNTGQTVLEN